MLGQIMQFEGSRSQINCLRVEACQKHVIVAFTKMNSDFFRLGFMSLEKHTSLLRFLIGLI